MPVRVLVVDDSSFFQHRLKEIINEHPGLSVVGVAANGREAIDKAAELKPDIITMDFEMPVMDGITAVKHIMAQRPLPILMFSSLTYEGARVTLDALAAGAMDFLPKDFAEVSRNSALLKQKLHERLLTLAGSPLRQSPAVLRDGSNNSNNGNNSARSDAPAGSDNSRFAPLSHTARASVANPAATKPAVAAAPASEPTRFKRPPRLLIIGASTGGPVALTEVLTRLPRDFPLPIVLVQHMPENFTKAFAERLDRQCQIAVREAVDGDHLQPGLALLAPGGKQLMFDKRNPSMVKVLADDERINYKPSLDITFASAANSYSDKVLGVVLTGMGSDGCQGARLLKEAGSSIWSQDEASCVIYGMPMAVAKAGLSDKVLSLTEIGPRLVREVG